MDTIFNINTFDAVVVGLILLISLKGLFSGFTKELFNALGIIGGIFIATFFNKDIAKYINENLGLDINSKILELLSLVLIFIAVLIAVKIIYKIISSISYDDYISTASRLAGMLIKMITLFFIFSLIVYALSSKQQVRELFKDSLSSSKLYPLLKKSGAAILNAPELINGSDSSINDNNSSVVTHSTEANATNETNNTLEAKEDKNITKKEIKDNTTVENSDANISTEKVEENATVNTQNESNATANESNVTVETNSSKE